MTRNQSTRGTLDACELRGGKLTPVTKIRVGARVIFTNPAFDYTVESVETDSIGWVRHRADRDTRSMSYEPSEFLYVQ
jgi:hypothetical protein